MPVSMIDSSSIAALLQTVIALVVIAVFVMAIVSFLMAIWDFITSKGESEKKEKWIKRIRFMMIGLILIIIFLILFPIFLQWIGVVYADAFTAPAIFTRVGQLLNYFFAIGGVLQDVVVDQGGIGFKMNPSLGWGVPSWYSL